MPLSGPAYYALRIFFLSLPLLYLILLSWAELAQTPHCQPRPTNQTWESREALNLNSVDMLNQTIRPLI